MRKQARLVCRIEWRILPDPNDLYGETPSNVIELGALLQVLHPILRLELPQYASRMGG